MSILKVIGAALRAGYERWQDERERDRALAELKALRGLDPELVRDLGVEVVDDADLEAFVDGRLGRPESRSPRPALKLVVDNPRCCAA